ncbi:TadE/TadG family type IV pilus assembly protein [Telluria beijingensis]|uniref:TadE/TadG family type IV pilus assembly protein n=1 Tax=Telluria beijingensis TaxID=3068633 RepID=UPI002795FBF2|nr:TadE family protein [Massilia sp. REN29]
MTRQLPAWARARQCGVAAIEMAIMLPMLVIMTIAPFFIAFYYWHYSAIHKSAYGAARYLSTVPVREMNSPDLAARAEGVARAIVAEGLLDLRPASTPLVSVQCDGLACGDGPPQGVLVDVRVRLADTFFYDVYTGDRGLLIQATVRMRYAGN